MANKKLIWIGIGSALLLGGGLFWWYKSSTAKEPQKEEDKSVAEEAVIKQEASTSTTPNLPSTPFKNMSEGNSFRVWMSVNHPDYRYKNDVLDKSGAFDNSFMRDAYQKYGSEYKSKISGSKTSVTSNGFKKNQLMYIKLDSSSIYKFPKIKGEYLLGTLNKSWLLDKAFGKFIEYAGNDFMKFETFAYVPLCPINARCTGLAEVVNEIAFIPTIFVSDKPY